MRLISMAVTLLFPMLASAQMFSAAEVQTHKDRIDLITSTASKCLVDTYKDHTEFFRRWGVS